MDSAKSLGQAERVMGFSPNKKVVINEKNLRKIFEHPDVKDRKIVAFSVIGALRKGKSFFLDYCLRFLYANYPSINYPNNPVSDPEGWMGDEDEPLNGFSWRSGTDRDTMGIVIWDDVFLYTDERTGEKIAIVIIDTQGLFDNETTTTNNSRIFALGTLISSIQVLNLSDVIQEDQLQYLQFATEFAKFALKDSQTMSEKPFQNLMFLIRDWQNPDDHPFTFAGGKSYLEKILKIKDTQKDELITVRKFIYASFENLDCFLLPNPGKIVTGVKKLGNFQYNGNWHDMDDDFKEELVKVIEYLLKPDNLVLKKINDILFDGSTYLEYLVQNLKLFQSEKLPKTQTIYESNVEKHFDILVNSCVDRYKFLIYEKPSIIEKIEELPIIHEASKNDVLLMYKDSKKMGNADHEVKFRKILENQIDKIYKEWKEQNETNIRKVEDEKNKTRMAEEEKQKLALDKLKLEQDAAKHKFELEKVKQDFEMQKLKFTKDNEIEQIKFKAETERQADERRHDIEKFKLEKEIDRIKILNETEIEKHALENEFHLKIAKQNVFVERFKTEAEYAKKEQEIQVQINEMERTLGYEKLKSEIKATESSNKAEQEQLSLKMNMELEKMRLERENDQQNYLRAQEVMKAEQKVEEQRLMNCLMQQKNDDMTKRLEHAEDNINQLRERDDPHILVKLLDSGIKFLAGGKRIPK